MGCRGTMAGHLAFEGAEVAAGDVVVRPGFGFSLVGLSALGADLGFKMLYLTL